MDLGIVPVGLYPPFSYHKHKKHHHHPIMHLHHSGPLPFTRSTHAGGVHYGGTLQASGFQYGGALQASGLQYGGALQASGFQYGGALQTSGINYAGPLQTSGVRAPVQFGTTALQTSGVGALPLNASAFVNPPLRTSAIGGAPLRTSVGTFGAPALQTSFVGTAPLQTTTQTVGLAASQSQIIDRQTVQTGEVIQGETYIEYVPFEREYTEKVAVERTEIIPKERRYIDYYAIENITEYVPVTTYEKVQEMVPQERTEYVAQTKVQYIPQVETEYVTVNKVQSRTDYVAQEKATVRYPEFEGEFIKEAETSGRIVAGTGVFAQSGLVSSGFLQPYGSNPNGNWTQNQFASTGFSQGRFVNSPGLKSPASVQEKYLLKKLEKDIKRLEAETKVQRSQSHSPGKKKHKHHHEDHHEDHHEHEDNIAEKVEYQHEDL